MNRRVRRYRGKQNRAQVAILGPSGRRWTMAAVIDTPVRLVKIANRDVERYCSEFDGAPSPKRACRQMLTAGRALGITKGARKFLRA